MLAAVLGAIIIFTASGIFAMMNSAKERQAQRLAGNMEFATAHRVIQQALRTLLMSDAPDPRDEELRERIERDIESSSPELVDIPEDDTAAARFTLQPDPTKRDVSGRPLQVLELAVKTAPVLGASRVQDTTDQNRLEIEYLARLRQGDSLLLADRRISASGSSRSSYASLTDDRRSSSRSGSRASRTDEQAGGRTGDVNDAINAATGASRTTDPAERRNRLEQLGRSFGSGSDDESARTLEDILQDSESAARAPGMRGAFEFRPEDDPEVLRRARAVGESADNLYSLWWREFPVGDGFTTEELDNDPALAQLARYSSSNTREVKLISGLRQARWQVFRTSRNKQRADRVHVDKITATSAKELPAYVELKFETLEGRREHWMFEVSWSTGPEPGSPITDTTAAGALEAQLRNAGGATDDKGNPIANNGQGAPGDPNGTGSPRTINPNGTGDNKPNSGHTVDLNPPAPKR